MYAKADIEELAEDFENCRKVLIALGDENRQHLILEMMKMENCSGARVGGVCTHCMACVHQCPREAVEFRKISVGKNRYYNQGK